MKAIVDMLYILVVMVSMYSGSVRTLHTSLYSGCSLRDTYECLGLDDSLHSFRYELQAAVE